MMIQLINLVRRTQNQRNVKEKLQHAESSRQTGRAFCYAQFPLILTID